MLFFNFFLQSSTLFSYRVTKISNCRYKVPIFRSILIRTRLTHTQKNRTFSFFTVLSSSKRRIRRRSRALPDRFYIVQVDVLWLDDKTSCGESCRCRDWRQWGGTPIGFSSRSLSMGMHKKKVVEKKGGEKKKESTPHGHWKLNNRCGNHEETYYFERVRVVRFSSFKVPLISRYLGFNDSISIGFILFPTFFLFIYLYFIFFRFLFPDIFTSIY